MEIWLKKTIRIYKEGILCSGLYLREERIYCKNGKEIYIIQLKRNA